MKLGQNGNFHSYHPLVCLIYFMSVISIIIISFNPIITLISLVSGFIYNLISFGKGTAKSLLLLSIFIVLASSLVNVLCTHNGETVILYVNNNRITVEALIFGLYTGIMLVAVLYWFKIVTEIMTGDKVIYLFGKVAPVLGLIISMILRLVPLLKKRMEEIRMGQRAMGHRPAKGLIGSIRQTVKEYSILIAWSLEASIDTADSMRARGYGTKHRTHFHLYSIEIKDIIMAIIIVVLVSIDIFCLVTEDIRIYFYPKITWLELIKCPTLFSISFILLCFIPILVDLYGEYIWKRLKSRI